MSSGAVTPHLTWLETKDGHGPLVTLLDKEHTLSQIPFEMCLSMGDAVLPRVTCFRWEKTEKAFSVLQKR
jgi:hypothetical protein